MTQWFIDRVRVELVLLLTAIGFLTRLPVPIQASWAGGRMVRASRYFPLVGGLIGAAGALVWWLAGLVLPPMVAAGVALAALVGLTGALHEDGLADTVDGLGGGQTADEALAIMRDSRIGGYGALALVLSVGLRWMALAALAPWAGVLALIIAGCIGRAMIVPATAVAIYARRPVPGALPGGARPKEVAAALATALVLAILGGWAGLLALVLALLVTATFLAYLVRRVGGYTGDGLGAIAQLGEITVMLTLAGAWA